MYKEIDRMPYIPAPNWMKGYNKSVQVKQFTIRENEFDLLISGKLFSKPTRHSFHILYYIFTEYMHYRFVAIDKADGELYWIDCQEEGGGEDPYEYYIYQSICLTIDKFLELTKDMEKYLPGVYSVFEKLNHDNRMDYISVTTPQLKAELFFMVERVQKDVTEILVFERGIGIAYIQCNRAEYENWKAEKGDIYQRAIYISELKKISGVYREERIGAFRGFKFKSGVSAIANKCNCLSDEEGNINLLYVFRRRAEVMKENIYDKVIDNSVNFIKFKLKIK